MTTTRSPLAHDGQADNERVCSAVERAAIAYIRELFAQDSGGHDANHSLRVWRSALDIAQSEPACDREIVSLAALLHDVDDHKLFCTEDNANARSFLSAHHIAPERIDLVCQTIESVSFSKNRGRKPPTIEGRVVQDADRLDAIGAIGVARAFAYGGEHGRPLAASVQHFHDKLLLLASEMGTDRGRELAASRHAFIVAFLQELDAETGGRI